MLFPLSKDFSSSSIFQKSGAHNERPINRVWTIDHTGQAERTKELHLLLTDQKPYKHHERLATKRAQEGQKKDAETMANWKSHLRDMYTDMDAQSEERRQEMYRQIRAFNRRKSASDSNIRSMLRDQSKAHTQFLNEMSERTWAMPPIWGGEPPRETRERTRARAEAMKNVAVADKQYTQEMKALKAAHDTRGPQEWAYVPRPSNETVQKRLKAKGLAELTAKKEEYEALMEGMHERENQRVLGERQKMKREWREADLRLTAEKAALTKSLNDTSAAKKAELDAIQARVNNRGAGRPDHPEFAGYATAGYAPVEKSSKRLRDHAAEKEDRDANHGESAAKLLCLSMPLSLRNKIVAAKPPKRADSLMGTGIDNPMEWTEMNWTQRWALLSRHAPQRSIQKAHEKAGMDSQGTDLSMTAQSQPDQRTLSPRALGLASS